MKQLSGLRKADKAHGDDTTLTRFIITEARHASTHRTGLMPATATGTRFKTRVLPPSAMTNILVSGHNNAKIGRDVRKGHLRGYWIYTLSLEERATCPASCAHWRDCFVPGTRVLTMGMDWVPVETLAVGDHIAGFDENAADGRAHTTREAIVEAVGRTVQPCYRLTTNKGEVIVSAGHLWLAKRDRSGFAWRQTADLKVGDQLPFFAKPWVQDLSYDAARLRGFVEGEGSVCTTGNNGFAKTRVQWSQLPGQLLNEINAVAAKLGFSITERNAVSGVNGSNVVLTDLGGGWRETMAFLGRIKPTRLMAKAAASYVGHSLFGRGSEPAIIHAVEFVGDRDVVTVQTSTRTMVAEGLFTHNCYGNSMPFAKRVQHGPEMLRRIEQELADLCRTKRGVLVRLHALGDFYSAAYVAFWDGMLRLHPNLAVFGYTAHHPGTEIGDAVGRVIERNGFARFAMRFSGWSGARGAVTVDDAAEAGDAIMCPQQTGAASHCATCALCWGSQRNIAFLRH